MEEVTKITYDAIHRYFNTLKTFGYKSYSDVNKLLILSYIEELLSSEIMYEITELDYKEIGKALTCLYGSSCLIRFPNYNTFDSIRHAIKDRYNARVSEDNILRISEENRIRSKA